MILGVDPGREKMGLALVDELGVLVERAIISPAELEVSVRNWLEANSVECVALGDATQSQSTRTRLEALLEVVAPNLNLQIVDERGSTQEARVLYWQLNPPRARVRSGGWREIWRCVWPRSLQMPPVPLDDFAAAIIARRALALRHSSS